MRQWQAKWRRVAMPTAFTGRLIPPRSIWNQKARRMAGFQVSDQIRLEWKMVALQ